MTLTLSGPTGPIDTSEGNPGVDERDDAQLLIKEARHRARFRRLGVVGLVVLLVGAGLAVDASLGGHPTSGHIAHKGSTLGTKSLTSLPPGTQMSAGSVVALNMFSERTGVAVNTLWAASGQPPAASYLTATTNSGSSWRVINRLPEAFATPLLAFASRQIGYLADQWRPRSLFATEDGGRLWTPVRLLGAPTSVTESEGSIWVVSDRCPTGALVQQGFCPTYLNVYQAGSERPALSWKIPPDDPALAQIVPRASRTLSATLLARTGPTSALVVEGADGPNALMETTDSGRTWVRMASPCGNAMVHSAVATSTARWLVMCSNGGAAGRADNALFATRDAGQSWSLLAEGNIQGPNIGGLASLEPGTFGASADGTTLWMTLGVGAIEVSTNGGRAWRTLGRNLIQYTAEPIVSRGPYAWLANSSGGLMRTTDGSHWGFVKSS